MYTNTLWAAMSALMVSTAAPPPGARCAGAKSAGYMRYGKMYGFSPFTTEM